MQQVKVSVVHLTLFRIGPFPFGHSSLAERPCGRNHIERLREPKDSSEIVDQHNEKSTKPGGEITARESPLPVEDRTSRSPDRRN